MTLLVAGSTGSLQHAYHFWIAYFLPSCEWLIDNPEEKDIKMVDCGPMNHWIEHLKKYRDIQIVKPSEALNMYITGSKLKVFDRYDKVSNILNLNFISRIDEIKNIFFNPITPDNTEIIVIERNKEIPFYSSKESDNKTAAATRRSIPNMLELIKLFKEFGITKSVDGTILSAQETVNQFSNASIIVGQHGAGLTNMVWMRPNSTIIEIFPKNIKNYKNYEEYKFLTMYKTIAQKMNFKYFHIEAQDEDNWHSKVDIDILKKEMRKNVWKYN